MGLFDSTTNLTTNTTDATIAPNLDTGSILGGGSGIGGGGPVALNYSPGGAVGQGKISVSSGGIIDQSVKYSTDYTSNQSSYSSNSSPSVIVGSPGASSSSAASGGIPSSILGLTWQAWGLIALAVGAILYFMRK